MTVGDTDPVGTAVDEPSPPRTRRRYWVLRVLVRLVPVVVVMQMSFEAMLRNDWFLWDSSPEPGQMAMLIAFVPAGIWAVADGYRLVPTGQVVAVWAVVGAAVVIQNHLVVGGVGFNQGMTLSPVEIVRWAEAALAIAGVHAGTAALLALLGAGLYRLRNTRPIRESMGSAESGG